jgi:hypothetical protein
MPEVNESETQLVFVERMAPGLRVFVFLVGFVPLLAPYELLIKPNWQGFSLFMILPIFISLGATSVGLAFMAAGLLGLNHALHFDAASKTVFYIFETAITPLRRRQYDFAEVATVEINVHTWDSSADTYGVRVTFADGRKVEVGSFTDQDKADKYLRRIQEMLR